MKSPGPLLSPGCPSTVGQDSAVSVVGSTSQRICPGVGWRGENAGRETVGRHHLPQRLGGSRRVGSLPRLAEP